MLSNILPHVQTVERSASDAQYGSDMRSLGARHAFSRTFVTRNDSEVRVPAVAAVDESCGKADMGRAIFRPKSRLRGPPGARGVTLIVRSGAEDRGCKLLR